MNIGLDFGGVVANHYVIKMRILQTHFGLTFTNYADVTRARLLPKIGKEACDKLALLSGEQTDDFPTFDGTKELLDTLAANGDTFHIVSTQTTKTEQDLWQYIQKHQLPIESISVVRTDKEKRQKCEEKKVQIFVDDNTSVLETLVPLNITLVLADFTHSFPENTSKFQVIHSWKEFQQTIRPTVS